MKTISIISPCFNEQDNVAECHAAVKALFERELPGYRREHIFADNASSDRTVEILREIAAGDPAVKIVVNARNFGVFRSTFNALQYATGDATLVLLPVDMQDPPALLPEFVRLWESGYDVVAGARANRQEDALMRAGRWTFYRIVNSLSDIKLSPNIGEFQLIDRKVLDAVLAHNAEAALLALALRPALRAPLVYVAHTLWSVELSAYLPRSKTLARAARAPGAALDRLLASRADATLVLARAAERSLAPHARGPIVRVSPGWTIELAPEPDEIEDLCHRHGLRVRGYAIYTGNLDAYQDLPELDAAAAVLAPRPVVVATHDSRAAHFRSLRLLRVASPEESRLLVYGARVAVVPRRHVGGFPIKLLQYLEAGRAVVARAPLADTLAHGESGWLLAHDADARELAGAIARVWDDPALAAKLGDGARRTPSQAVRQERAQTLVDQPPAEREHERVLPVPGPQALDEQLAGPRQARPAGLQLQQRTHPAHLRARELPGGGAIDQRPDGVGELARQRRAPAAPARHDARRPRRAATRRVAPEPPATGRRRLRSR